MSMKRREMLLSNPEQSKSLAGVLSPLLSLSSDSAVESPKKRGRKKRPKTEEIEEEPEEAEGDDLEMESLDEESQFLRMQQRAKQLNPEENFNAGGFGMVTDRNKKNEIYEQIQDNPYEVER